MPRRDSIRASRYGGRYVVVGFASAEIPRVPLNLVLLKGVILKGFSARGFSENEPDKMRRDTRELADHFAHGRLRPYVSARFPLNDVVAAMRTVQDRQVVGKVVIDVSNRW